MFEELADQYRTVEFRDGPHDVPTYLADMMAGLPTHTMTVEEAISAANAQALDRFVSTAYDQVVKQHFGGTPR